MLNDGKVIEWHRVQAYQDVSLKLILQEVLQDLAFQRANDKVFLHREVVREPLLPMPPLSKERYHLFVSPHNVGALAMVKLLHAYRSSRPTTHGRFQDRRMPSVQIKVTSDPKQMTCALHYLCYLNADTHTNSASAEFHAELERALRANMHILLVHETRHAASGAPFKQIIDATPDQLKWDHKLAQKRLYKELAVMICGSVGDCDHLNVGLHLLSNAISQTPKNVVAHADVDPEENEQTHQGNSSDLDQSFETPPSNALSSSPRAAGASPDVCFALDSNSERTSSTQV